MKTLLISTAEVKRMSIMNGSIDDDKFIQFIEIAQDITVQGYLGKPLLDKLIEKVPFINLISDLIDRVNGEGGVMEETTCAIDVIDEVFITKKYNSLIENYVKPLLVHWALVEIIPFISYSIGNNGISKPRTEISESITKAEVDYLVSKQRDIADSYTKKFLDFMTFNSADYPEYLEYSNLQQKNYDSNFSGWELGGFSRNFRDKYINGIG